MHLQWWLCNNAFTLGNRTKGENHNIILASVCRWFISQREFSENQRIYWEINGKGTDIWMLFRTIKEYSSGKYKTYFDWKDMLSRYAFLSPNRIYFFLTIHWFRVAFQLMDWRESYKVEGNHQGIDSNGKKVSTVFASLSTENINELVVIYATRYSMNCGSIKGSWSKLGGIYYTSNI